MTKDQVSRLCARLDEQVQAFRERPLEGAYPCLWLDAKQEKVRDGAHVRSKALVIAHGVHESGRREVIGLDVGEIESEAFWREFLRSLRRRGLDGVRLCVSDAHEGLKAAIARVLGCPWQRCCVHFVRDMHQHCRPAQRALVSAALREVFTAYGHDQARERVTAVIEQLAPTAPKVAELLADAEADLLAFYRFPAEHWTKLRSTNPLERVNREIGRRSHVVGIFPNDAALIRLAGMLPIEQNDEWLVGRRYPSQESLAALATRGTELSGTTDQKRTNIHWKRNGNGKGGLRPRRLRAATRVVSPTIASYTTKRDLTDPSLRRADQAPGGEGSAPRRTGLSGPTSPPVQAVSGPRAGAGARGP
jgi:transposase-like protein